MECDKVNYDEEWKAKQVANMWRKQGKPMKTYFCKSCKAWHLTKK